MDGVTVWDQLPEDGDAPMLRLEMSCRCGVQVVEVDGADCVGTPVADEELRNVFEGAGAASLDPEVLIVSGTVPSILTIAAAMRSARFGVEFDSERVRLIAAVVPRPPVIFDSRLARLSLQ